ncbi:MFS transporter [Patescibacteria group bacterium]|nr:MFS transporter [Patescibacteria group bacterium]
MVGKSESIIAHNMRVFYVVDSSRALFFLTSIWVLFERQFLTLSQLTLIEACIVGTTLVMQLPTGAFADLFGKRKAMILGGSLYVLAFIIYSFSSTFSMFLLYAFFLGLAAAFIDGTREALLYDTLRQEHREHTFPVVASKLSVILQIGLSISVLIGGFIGSFSYVYAIWMTACAFVISTIASFFFREPLIDTEKFSIANYARKTKQGVEELLKNSYIKKISLFYILIGSVTWTCAFSLNMVLLTGLAFSSKEMGITLSIGRIINGVILFGLISTTAFFNRNRTFTLLPLLLAVCLVPSVFLTKWFALIPVICAMFGSMVRWNILGRYTNAEFSSKNRATAISALNMAIGIVYVIVMGFSGPIMERFGDARIIYTFFGFVSLLVILPLGLHLAKHHGEKALPVKEMVPDDIMHS